MPTLILVDNEKNTAIGAPIKVEDSVTIGRAATPPTPGVDIFLQDPRVSRPHARIFRTNDGRYCVEDLGSSNGTALNGQRLEPKQPYLLKHEDKVYMGRSFHFIFEHPQEDDTVNPKADNDENDPFPGYEIINKIADDTNGGNIFCAKQKSLGRDVLLWVFPLSNVENTQDNLAFTHQVFIERISKMAQLFHPNLMMLLDFSVSDRYCLCAFENVDWKKDLNSYLKHHKENKQSIPADKVIHLGTQLASGLHYAHQHQIFHLNLSARNILIQPGQQERLIITEFGLSSFMEATAHLRMSGLMRENGQYVAPEYVQSMIQNKPGDKQENEKSPDFKIGNDIYAYGCILYHLLAGMPPFYADKLSDLYQMHLKMPPPPLTEKCPNVHPRLAALVHRCLEKNPQNRHKNFEEIMQELDAIAQDIRLGRKTIPKITTPQEPPKTLVRWWIMMPLLGILLGLVGFFLMPLILP